MNTFGTLLGGAPAAELGGAGCFVDSADVPTELVAALRDMDLLAQGDVPRAWALASSSDSLVYRVDLGWGTICYKQALPHGDAVVDAFTNARAAAEVAWFKLACSIAAGAAPVVLGTHPSRAAFATDFLDPVEFPSWRSQLAEGDVDAGATTELGHLLGRLHAASANSDALQERFSMQTAFHALCLEPVFHRIALEAPNRCARLAELAESLTTTRVALVHGALTPDNVLLGPCGPVLIDADCAHYGDPMFDVATCTAALAARMATRDAFRPALAECIEAFRQSYFSHLTWEIPEHAEARAARLTPALMAAAIADEEIESGLSRRARAAVHRLLAEPPARLDELTNTWQSALGEE